MICFTDNDILHKLSAFDLWEEARAVLSVRALITEDHSLIGGLRREDLELLLS